MPANPAHHARLGAEVDLADLERDPYPIYARLRSSEPISWIEALGMWYVTRYEDVRAIIRDTERFTTASGDSLIHETFGAHMLTTEGAEHDRYRRAVQHSFMPGLVRQAFEAGIAGASSRLIAEFKAAGEIELRSAFAARIPVQTILAVFGMSMEAEGSMRRWYDAFEKALSNFARDPDVRSDAQRSVAEFRAHLSEAIHGAAALGGQSLLHTLVNAPRELRLSDAEIMRNMSIIFFGGISTVEALILNSLWALLTHREVFERVRADLALAPKVIEETIRWMSPVQSATRHVVRDTEINGVHFASGAIVNCMLGAANRDPAMFAEPDRFDIDRADAQRHLGFAIGPHACLGMHLAKAEARIALCQLLTELPGLRLIDERASTPRGYEFRQPRSMLVAWNR